MSKLEDIKIWFENDLLYIDVEYLGFRPNWFQMDSSIKEVIKEKYDVIVNCESGQFVVKGIGSNEIPTVYPRITLNTEDNLIKYTGSRIDEIKEFVKHDSYYKNDGGDYCDVSEDVEYLLSKLEIAEKALEECKQYDEQANCNWCGGKIKEITTTALQKLRS